MDDNISMLLGEIKTNICHIRQDILEMKPVIKGHDEDIRDVKTSIKLLKLIGSAVAAVGAFFGFGGNH